MYAVKFPCNKTKQEFRQPVLYSR